MLTLAARRKSTRSHRPELVALEGRALMSTATTRAPGHIRTEVARPPAVAITLLPDSTPSQRVNGYKFLNFDGPTPGTAANTGTNLNGIANNGTVVGFTIANGGALGNFTARPRHTHAASPLNINGATNASAFGINAACTVVGSDGKGNAFFVARRTLRTFLPAGASTALAFGINDGSTIVGQQVVGAASPGFIRLRNGSYVRIDAPSGPDTVNAQGINNRGLVVGFYTGADGQVHGLTVNQGRAKGGSLTGTAVADPVIPVVAGEPGATFVFSQILGVNDRGIAVGYYGDSTTSQHGFLYDTRTGRYTFLDDPKAAFNNGVEVTQITGITNSGEIAGFYSDANGVFHGFVAAR